MQTIAQSPDRNLLNTLLAAGPMHGQSPPHAMEEGHRPLWRHFIEAVPETDLSTREIFNFGCNRSGFLQPVYTLKPLKYAIGVDIACDFVAAARDLVGPAPRLLGAGS